MTDKEALVNLKEAIRKLNGFSWQEKYPEALSHLTKMAEENERLRAEVREWICESCNTVYPAPPQAGFQCVVCPKCGGSTRPRLQAENAALRAEVERLKKLICESTVAECDYRAKWGMCDQLDDVYELKARAEKAEAELEELRDVDNRVECWTCHQLKIPEDMNYQCLECWAEKEVAKDEMVSDLKAELARYQPLIEAANELNPEWVRIELDELSRIRTEGTPTMRLLRAALACRDKS